MSPEPGLDRRSFTDVTAAAAMVGLAGCAALQPAGETTNSEAAESWPDPK